MRALRSWLGVLGTLGLGGLPALADAQGVGSEFQINTYTTLAQATAPFGGHLVAADASGNFVVVWRSYTQDGSSYGIFGQRYDSAGAPEGGEFQINSFTTDTQSFPSVASDASGNFVVIWNSYSQDGNRWGVFGQRYDSAGAPQGGEFQVNSFTTGSQLFPSVASDASGNFVVVWSSDRDISFGIFGQRYDSAGAPQGGEFQINSFTTDVQEFPSVASDASGNFVVVWESYAQDGSNWGVFGQRYDSAGATLGSEFQINSFTTNHQRFPSVASDADGNFVVVWSSYDQDGGSYGIFGQRYDSAGGALGSEFQVNSFTTNSQDSPSVASDADGYFVVAWESFFQDGSNYGTFGQRYDSGGVAQGNEFQSNSFTTSFQGRASVGATGTNQFVAVWESYAQDGSSMGVFGQRYDFGDTTPPEVAMSSAAPDPTNVAPIPVTVQFSENVTGFMDTDIVTNGTVGNFVAVDGDTYTFDLIPGGQGLVTADIAAGVAQDAAGNGNTAAAQFSRTFDNVLPTVTVSAPNGGERLFTGSSYLIQWTASDATALSFFDVFFSVNGGGSFAPIAECQHLLGSATSCPWLAPGPPSGSALVRVGAQDTAGNLASDESDAVFSIASGTASVTVTNPNANVRWRIGSVQTITWAHNLGLNSSFRIELDRNNDSVFEELIVAGAPATTPRRGTLAWTVTGPASGTARVRVSWTGNPAGVNDSSDTTFQIRPGN